MVPGTTEVTTNLFSLYDQEVFGQGSRAKDQNDYANADAALAGGSTWDALDVWAKLTFYRRLSLAYPGGWSFYRQLYRQTREGARRDKEAPVDYLLRAGSQIFQKDLRGYFAYYRLSPSAGALAEVAAMGLPVPSPAIETLHE
jgi:hypothetical protein